MYSSFFFAAFVQNIIIFSIIINDWIENHHKKHQQAEYIEQEYSVSVAVLKKRNKIGELKPEPKDHRQYHDRK